MATSGGGTLPGNSLLNDMGNFCSKVFWMQCEGVVHVWGGGAVLGFHYEKLRNLTVVLYELC
jgi:hypothetical protein